MPAVKKKTKLYTQNEMNIEFNFTFFTLKLNFSACSFFVRAIFTTLEGNSPKKRFKKFLYHSLSEKLFSVSVCLWISFNICWMKLIFFSSVVQQIGDTLWAQSTHAHIDFIHKNLWLCFLLFFFSQSSTITQRRNLISLCVDYWQ